MTRWAEVYSEPNVLTTFLYARKHRVDFLLYGPDYLPQGAERRARFMHDEWYAIAALRDALLQGYQRVIYLDGENCYIHRDDLPFDALFALSTLRAGPGPPHVALTKNHTLLTDVLFLKNTPEALSLLTAWWSAGLHPAFEWVRSHAHGARAALHEVVAQRQDQVALLRQQDGLNFPSGFYFSPHAIRNMRQEEDHGLFHSLLKLAMAAGPELATCVEHAPAPLRSSPWDGLTRS